MPMVDGKKYSYDKKGISAAKKAAVAKKASGSKKPKSQMTNNY
jgi:hypothetical protein